MRRSRPYYDYKLSFWPLAGIMMMVIIITIYTQITKYTKNTKMQNMNYAIYINNKTETNNI